MWLLLSILAIPLIEIGLFVQIGGAIGVWATLAWVVLTGAAGVLLLRWLGARAAVSVGQDIRRLRDPLSPVAQHGLLVFAGLLLILPGFFTDALGLLLMLPPVRFALTAYLRQRMTIMTPSRRSDDDDVIDGEWREADEERPPERRLPPSGWTRH
jgi:UPF0716 protein FxsA